jgi:hypothetical protein
MAKRGARRSTGDSVIKRDEATGERYFDLEPGHMKYAERKSRQTNGKGDSTRPHNKKKYDAEHVRIFGH